MSTESTLSDTESDKVEAESRPTRPRPSSAIGRVRWALAENMDLPSLGELGPRIATAALSANNDVDQIADLALFDPAVLLKMLRAANSPAFLTRSGDPVCSISRAIMLLGFNETRQTALALRRLDETVTDPDHDRLVRGEYAHANMAAMFARNLLYGRNPAVAEEGAMLALFGASARILTAIHAPQAMAMVLEAIDTHGTDPTAAARRVLGASFDELNLEALHAWHMPARIAQVLRTTTNLRPRQPETGADWLPLSVACANDVTRAITQCRPQDRKTQLAALVEKYGHAVDLNERELETMIEDSAGALRRIDVDVGPAMPSAARLLTLHRNGEIRSPLPVPKRSVDELSAMAAESGSAEDAMALLERIAEGKQGDPGQVLSAALSAIEKLLAQHASSLAPVLSMVLAGIKMGMNYSRVSYFARDDSSSTFRPRLAIGTPVDRLRQHITMGTGFSRDLLHAALSRGVDLHIGDVSATNVQQRLPDWFGNAYPDTLSFLILPIRVEDRPVGFILADRDEVDPDGPSPDELNKLRNLRNQIGALHMSGMAEMDH